MLIHPATTGIILAGGKSSRMGFDKGMALLNGKPMIEWVIENLQVVCTQIIIISNGDTYQHLGFPVYPDLYLNRGPIGGIVTGLTHSSTASNLVLACDMPFVKPVLLNQLLAHAGTYPLVVPSLNRRFEPLCAFYHQSTRVKMEQLLLQQVWKMQDVIRTFTYKEIALENVESGPQMFANINTPEELKQRQINSRSGS